MTTINDLLDQEQEKLCSEATCAEWRYEYVAFDSVGNPVWGRTYAECFLNWVEVLAIQRKHLFENPEEADLWPRCVPIAPRPAWEVFDEDD